VAVIGAGIAGVTTAYLLAKQGVDVVLVEATTIGSGTTGHTTGKVSAAHGMCYEPLTRKHGAPTAAAYARLNQGAMNLIDDLRQAEQIECDWRRRDAYTYTVDPSTIGDLRAECEAARQAGLACELVSDFPLAFAAGAVRTPDQAEFHAVKWTRGLADAAERHGARIFENSRVHGISGGSPCTVRCAGGELEAERVVICTHFPMLDRGLFFARMSPQRSYCLGLTLKAQLPTGMFLSVDSPTRSIRTHPLGDGDELLIVGGQGHKAGQEESASERYDILESWAREHFEVDAVRFRWSAQDPMPPDQLPYVGNLRPGSDRILVATGFAKWGLSNGTAAAQILAGLLTEQPHEDGETFNSNRFDPVVAGPTLIKENLNVAKRMVGDKLARPQDRESIAPGMGAIVRHGARRAAAFRSDDGTLHEYSATCTHFGCELRFNDAERSWDCPCHGSRFDARTGGVLEGPAVKDLRPFD
jgi:glycine/D-amino acid oxidase-like deaminating enzyme/nitrite reductase/ring-hydroxylating ferredoxin subunit